MDLYNIPGDTGGDWRLQKFVEYQHEVPSIHYRVLGEYIKKYCDDKDEAVFMCWYMSCTYNEVTCVLLNELIDLKEINKHNYKQFFNNLWSSYKTKLDFGSSRKYAKNMDWFPELMRQFYQVTKAKPYRWLKKFSSGEKGYRELFLAIMNIRYVGRFATDLFMESVLYLNDYFETEFVEPEKLDWKNCSNLTSGLLNIFYMDEEANLYDKTRKLPVSEDLLNEYLSKVKDAIYCAYPEQKGDGINLFIGKICSFRNLFKSSRYGGFHHDRELGVLKEYEKILPEYNHLWKRLYNLRLDMFPDHLLGELNGWDGIRNERKKLFLSKGLTGVENKTMNKRLLINLRGCNGSGKSTIPLIMMDDPDMFIVEKPYKGKSKKILTVFPKYNFVALGSYLNKTGGMDTFPDTELCMKAMNYAIGKFPKYDILMEGIMASTVYSTWRNAYKEVEKKHPEIEVVILNLTPPLEIALQRVQERNGGKSVNNQAIESKYNTVVRNAKKFKRDGFKSEFWNTAECEKSEMLYVFRDMLREWKSEVV